MYGITTQPEKRKGQNAIVSSPVFLIENRENKLDEKSRIILKTSHDKKS